MSREIMRRVATVSHLRIKINIGLGVLKYRKRRDGLL